MHAERDRLRRELERRDLHEQLGLVLVLVWCGLPAPQRDLHERRRVLDGDEPLWRGHLQRLAGFVHLLVQLRLPKRERLDGADVLGHRRVQHEQRRLREELHEQRRVLRVRLSAVLHARE
jgi:hypothetical protein